MSCWTMSGLIIIDKLRDDGQDHDDGDDDQADHGTGALAVVAPDLLPERPLLIGSQLVGSDFTVFHMRHLTWSTAP